MSAVNEVGEGKASVKVPEKGLVFDEGGITQKVNFSEPKRVDSNTITLNWHGIPEATGYRITYLNAINVPVKIDIKGVTKTSARRKSSNIDKLHLNKR